MLLLGQILAVSVFPLGGLWFYFFVNRGHEMTPELNKWSKILQWPKWFYFAPAAILFWVVGMIIVAYVK